jgi:hypothetical protein
MRGGFPHVHQEVFGTAGHTGATITAAFECPYPQFVYVDDTTNTGKFLPLKADDAIPPTARHVFLYC